MAVYIGLICIIIKLPYCKYCYKAFYAYTQIFVMYFSSLLFPSEIRLLT